MQRTYIVILRLYDYSKNISEIVGNITDIQKQLQAYAGDTSEQAMATVQKLRQSLQEEQTSLQEAQRKQYIEDLGNILDDLLDQYSSGLYAQLDDTNALLEGITMQVEASADIVADTISDTLQGTGYEISSALENIWQDAEFKGLADSVTSALDELTDYVAKIYSNTAAEEQAASNVSSAASSATGSSSSSSSGSSSSSSSNSSSSSSGSSSSSSSSSKSDIFDKYSFFVYKKDSYTKSKLNKDTSIVDRLKYFDIASDKTNRTNYYKGMGYSGTYTGSSSQNQKMLSWMKSAGYAQGLRSASTDESAWTQQNGSEAIVRKSDGAVWTSLSAGDSVLTSAATNNLWSMANNPAEFIARNSGGAAPMCDINVQKNISNTIDLTINLPNVKNYAEFMNAAKDDSKFEELVQAMTTDRIGGRSSMAKNRLHWQ